MAKTIHRKILNKKRLVTIIVSLLFGFCHTQAQIDTDHVLFMGRSALASSDYVTAMHYFNQVIEAKPFLWQPYYYRAYTKFLLDDYVGSEADCSKSIQTNPYQVDVYQLRGLCRIRLERYEQASEDYSRTLLEKPTDVGALYNRGLCFLQLKRYDKAREDMDALLKCQPSFYRAYAIKAQVALAEKDTMKGIGFIDELLKLNPENADGWSFKGRYALEKKKYAEADSLLTKAIKYQPGNYECYIARALARHGMNHFGAAIADYDKTIEIVPQHFVAHYNRGLLLALVGNNNRAIDDFTFVIKQEPDNILAIYNRALLRKETGDYRGAIADFTRMIRQYPNFTYGYLARAECRRKIGDKKGALNDETVVARANLDINFGKSPRRYPIKRYRQPNDHSLDHYQELVDESDNDSTGSVYAKLLSSNLFGRVQNKHTEKKLMSPFMFTFKAPLAGKGYRSVAYIEQAAKLSKQFADVASLDFSAEQSRAVNNAEVSSAQIQKKMQKLHGTDSLMIASVLASDLYDYESANTFLQEAGRFCDDEQMLFVLNMQHAIILYYSNQVEENDNAEALDKHSDIKGNYKTQPLTSKKRLTTAAAILSQLSDKTKSRNQYVAYNQGCVAVAIGNAEQAISFFTKAIDIDKRFAEAYFNRALLRLDMGDKEGARQDLSRAGELGLYKAYALLKQV